MFHPTEFITFPATTSASAHSLRQSIFLSAFFLALAAFVFLPAASAVNPPPDGAYPNGNTAEGDDALLSLTTGVDNTALGFNALLSNTSGEINTATGFDALRSNTTGNGNTADGAFALDSNTTGISNTATGISTLRQNISGFQNSAYGAIALQGNTTGYNNTAIGFDALAHNSTGLANTATGSGALEQNITGHLNTATGADALASNISGSQNTATGLQALLSNTAGSSNTADGYGALQGNTTGLENTASGLFALVRNTTGKNNIAVGFEAGQYLTTGNNNIDIGNAGVTDESNRIRIGTVGTQRHTYIAGIYGATVARGVGVIVGADGRLGTIGSSERLKDGVKAMDKASEAIFSLEPVTFHYKRELDPDSIPQFGLVAEQVAKVNPALVARDDEGNIYTVRYEAVNAMLLNEFLKEHVTVQTLKTSLEDQKKAFEEKSTQQQQQIETLRADLNQQALFIQQVTDRIERPDSDPANEP